MEIDARRLEAELARIFRGYGVLIEDFHGVKYLGISSVYPGPDGHPPRVPSMPRSEVVALDVVARDIAEALR